MNKAELIDAIREPKASQKQIDAILSAMLDTIVEAVSSGDKVVLIGFGSFESKNGKLVRSQSPYW
jgi:DNA-binding protein HU-beta